MNKKEVYLSVIIPAYNEEANLKKGVLTDVYSYLKNKTFSWEVLISDDGSSDITKKLVSQFAGKLPGFRLISNPHGGKPAALQHGIKSAIGKYILFSDMDQSTPIKELDKLLPFANKYEVVIGSRGLIRKNFPFYRRLGSIVFVTLRRLLILPEIEDTQCGFKLFEKKLLNRAFPLLEFFRRKKIVKGWKVTSFDVELLQILKEMGTKIKEVKVDWHDEDVSTSKGNPLKKYINESSEMLHQIIRVKLNDIRGMYSSKK